MCHDPENSAREVPMPTDVAAAFAVFPQPITQRLLLLRNLVFLVAAEHEDVGEVEETLKWGEPSYLTKQGSTLRMAGKRGDPAHYWLYFHCKTSLVDTFRELYGAQLSFEGNRAITFHIDTPIPIDSIKHCILLALTYHTRKHLPLLGA